MNINKRVVISFVVAWFLFYIFVYVVFMSDGTGISLDSAGSNNNGRKIIKSGGSSEGGTGGVRGLKIEDTPFAKLTNKNNNNNNNNNVGGGGDGFIQDIKRFVSSVQHSQEAAVAEQGARAVPLLDTNPFLSNQCSKSLDAGEFGSISVQSVAVIIPVRNEAKEVLLHTVDSVIKNSGTALRSIVIVDDWSDNPIVAWPEWGMGAFGYSTIVRVVRAPHRLGVSGAKSFGATLATQTSSEVDMLVFLDAHVVVSDRWLVPLASILRKHPHTIAYPVIDVIDPRYIQIFFHVDSASGF